MQYASLVYGDGPRCSSAYETEGNKCQEAQVADCKTAAERCVVGSKATVSASLNITAKNLCVAKDEKFRETLSII